MGSEMCIRDRVINKTGASKFENKLKYFLRKETKLGGLKVEVN